MTKLLLVIAALGVLAIGGKAQSRGVLLTTDGGARPCAELRGSICSTTTVTECTRWTVIHLYLGAISFLPIPVSVCAEIRTKTTHQYYD